MTWKGDPIISFCVGESIRKLFSNSLRSNENNLIYFRKQLGNKGKRFGVDILRVVSAYAEP